MSAKSDKRDRADKVLVARGLFDSRSAAQAAIAVGAVTVSGKLLSKPSEKIAMNARIEAVAAHPWVSRGGVKLAHALDLFGVEVAGKACLDIGASTGGFTHVLLERGAASVVAVDVGRGQLHPQLRDDARVTSLEGFDARQLTAAEAGAPDIVVCDASFIALEKLLGVALSLAAPKAALVTLFKPQFQVGRAHVGKGGIVTSMAATQEAEVAFTDWLAAAGWQVLGAADSPITGGDGNRERLLHAVRVAA